VAELPPDDIVNDHEEDVMRLVGKPEMIERLTVVLLHLRIEELKALTVKRGGSELEVHC
jgi:hypothetical protein